MDDLVAFLRARLDEDEQVALESIGQTGVMLAGADAASVSVWRVVERPATGTFVTARDQWDRVTEVVPTYGGMYAEHIARHDPARVLRETQAHRTTVDEYDIAMWAQEDADQAAYWQARRDVLRETCLRVATVYADHPDYLEDWRP
ncbi:DUF6221 family protein [Streptomyces sp. NPDC087525]|uniref:DUF6221 family protein n=1 Tax=Streptomyces sp. NPDC087525 TaxID=3365793 RepID=UPI003828C9C9